MGQQSSGGNRGGGNRNNRNRNRGGNRNRNRGGGGNRNRKPSGNQEWRPGDSPKKRKPQAKPQKKGIGAKILGFFGLGKEKPAPKGGPAQAKGKPNAGKGKAATKRTRKKRTPQITEPESGRLYVGNLSYQTTEESLSEFFGKAGTVKSSEIIKNPHNGKSKGFGFVEMGSLDEAKKVVSDLQGASFDGREIVVSGARSGGPKQGGERGKGGPRGDRKERGSDRGSQSSGVRRERNDKRRGGRGGRGDAKQKRSEQNKITETRKVEVVTTDTLSVLNLDVEATEEDVSGIFTGVVEPNEVVFTAGDQPSADVKFGSIEDAQKAVEILHGKKFMGKSLKLTASKTGDQADTPAPAPETSTESESSVAS